MGVNAVAGTPGPSLQYSIDSEVGLLVIEVLSIDDGPALFAALRSIRRDVQFDACRTACVDCTMLRTIPSPDDVARIARAFIGWRQTDGPTQWAFIAAWTPIYDAARAFIATPGLFSCTLGVFETWSDVRVWLAATKPLAEGPSWIGPSKALNELMRRQPTGVGR